jgi:YHS domain-containing protein
MTKRIGRPALVAAAILCASALVFAHDPKKKSAMTGDMMNECGEHHSAAMKASDQVNIHLAEAKSAGTLAEMRRHVEMAQSAMADMGKHMSMCVEMVDKTHGGMMGSEKGMMGDGMMGSGTTSGDKSTAGKIIDPVCNMEVADTKTAPTLAYMGKTYYFCSEEDKAKFQKKPDQYVH